MTLTAPTTVPLAADLTITDLREVSLLVFFQLRGLAEYTIKKLGSINPARVWLADNLTGQRVEFYFSFDRDGTAIGFDPAVIDQHREHAYTVLTSIEDGGKAFLTWQKHIMEEQR